MGYYYFATENTFYHSDIHQAIPPEAVAITDKKCQQLLEGRSQGLIVMPDSNGKPVLTDPPPSDFHQWNGRKWTLDKAGEQAVITAEKSAKLREINQQAQGFIHRLAKLDETPEFERETWSIQREEAKAWIADKSVETPTLATIAQMRGVPLDVLRQKAYEKAVVYQTVAAIVAGQRQAYEDRLAQAETLEQVQAIAVSYQLPMEENNAE